MLLTSNLVPSGGASKTTTSIVNGFSSGAPAGVSQVPNSDSTCKQTLSGALTAATLKNMITVSGSAGKMPVCAVSTQDVTSRTLRIKVVCDGFTCFDSTSAAIAATTTGISAAGMRAGSTSTTIGDEPISWKSSMTVDIASSLTETDKVLFISKYALEA